MRVFLPTLKFNVWYFAIKLNLNRNKQRFTSC
uniref:Uncharacterized protein n=1 Tax=Lepeophtheirus salmonis TaxID=72036 RepID=A0A0K2U834_LEPSM